MRTGLYVGLRERKNEHSGGTSKATRAAASTRPSPVDLGYLVSVACPCGVVSYRCITPEDAAREMILSAMLAMPS